MSYNISGSKFLIIGVIVFQNVLNRYKKEILLLNIKDT